MLIVCDVPGMENEMMEVDREYDLWYEKDYALSQGYAVMIYPKLHWSPVIFIELT